MSVGTSALAVEINTANKTMRITGGPAIFRQLVTVTISGFGTLSPSNWILQAYRGSTLVALAQTPTDNGATCDMALDLNTEEMEDAFADAHDDQVMEFDLFLYDSVTTDLLSMGVLKVRNTRVSSLASPVTPVADTTVFVGSFAFYNGFTYVRSSTDGLYYKFALAGSGSEVTESIDTVGITIPGAP